MHPRNHELYKNDQAPTSGTLTPTETQGRSQKVVIKMTIRIELKSEPDNDFSDQKNQKTGEKGIVKIFEIMKTAWPWSLRKRYCMDCPELCFTNPVGAVATENQLVCKNPAAMTSFIEGPFIETIQWAGHCSWDARAILAHRDTESLPSQSLHSSEETDNRK